MIISVGRVKVMRGLMEVREFVVEKAAEKAI
jgi:hypothetical protein